jgi:hypothetical protein
VISYKLLGTQEWFVVHHSDCGMQLFDDAIMSGLLEQSLQTATIDEKGWHDHGHGPGSVQGHYVKWLTFKDLKASVVEDVNASDHILWCPVISRFMATITRWRQGGWSKCRKRWLQVKPRVERRSIRLKPPVHPELIGVS